MREREDGDTQRFYTIDMCISLQTFVTGSTDQSVSQSVSQAETYVSVTAKLGLSQIIHYVHYLTSKASWF
jgi:hypothetical protein